MSTQVRARTIAVASAAVLLAGCSLAQPWPRATSDPFPIDPDAVTDAERMVVEPEVAESGQLVELTLPGGHDRGTLFAIDAATGGGWERMAMLLSDAGGGRPTWFHLDDPDMGVEPIGVVGEGPDSVPIPDGLPPGDYRVCTANAVENLCVPIGVLEP